MGWAQEVLELNFLFRRTNYAQLLRSLDTKDVSRSACRKLIDHARCEEVLRFVRYDFVAIFKLGFWAEKQMMRRGVKGGRTSSDE